MKKINFVWFGTFSMIVFMSTNEKKNKYFKEIIVFYLFNYYFEFTENLFMDKFSQTYK